MPPQDRRNVAEVCGRPPTSEFRFIETFFVSIRGSNCVLLPPEFISTQEAQKSLAGMHPSEAD